jgi:amino acid adenylation domain-containing protein
MSCETLYSLLQQAAAVHGTRTAIDFDGRCITYLELLDASDRLAGLLADLGAAPGRRVAFCFHKSIDALMALFAIIRTGATYVPLDPTWPDDRLRTICQDAEAVFWVGSSPPTQPGGFDAVIVTDPEHGDAVPLARWRTREPSGWPAATPAHGIANILYTSGSTGRPKGVQITAESLLHFSDWVVGEFSLGPDDRLANHAPYHSDLSTLDIFAAVRAGAAMCPVPAKLRMFPYLMARFICEQRITIWYSVPSALIMMRRRGALADHNVSPLRHVIFAGEVMPKTELQAIAREWPHVSLTNLYGPTETNVCTYFHVDPAELLRDSPIPIGRHIRGARLWAVNEHEQPINNGQAGELWVAGPTVTQGYWGDAALTAQQLVPAPDGNGQAYRTGDRVQRRADGEWMFEGRIDRMIKCRGHRIEPGEIEVVLQRHPDIREAAVVPVPDPVFGNLIKACVVPRDGRSTRESVLAAFCRKHLPDHMVPDIWQTHEDLPRTDRGKVDYHALLE